MTAIRLEGLTTHEELTAAGRSAIYRFLAEAFAFPTPELGDTVASGRFRDELLAAYDGTAPYCMTLQEFIDFDLYVRCFTFGKTDITPVAYDPCERRYLVDHDYLPPSVGDRVVRDAQAINLALGYEMNTIEFAIKDGVPYAIDFLNPAPDFERARIRDVYFHWVVEKMADLAISYARGAERPPGRMRWDRFLRDVGTEG